MDYTIDVVVICILSGILFLPFIAGVIYIAEIVLKVQ